MYMYIHIQGGKEEMSYYKMKSVRRIKGGREGVNPDCVTCIYMYIEQFTSNGADIIMRCLTTAGRASSLVQSLARRAETCPESPTHSLCIYEVWILYEIQLVTLTLALSVRKLRSVCRMKYVLLH